MEISVEWGGEWGGEWETCKKKKKKKYKRKGLLFPVFFVFFSSSSFLSLLLLSSSVSTLTLRLTIMYLILRPGRGKPCTQTYLNLYIYAVRVCAVCGVCDVCQWEVNNSAQIFNSSAAQKSKEKKRRLPSPKRKISISILQSCEG